MILDALHLTACFLGQARARDELAAVPPDEVGQLLVTTLASARAAWPEIDVEELIFVRYLAERVTSAQGAGALASLHADDLYLACACLHGDPRALALFESRYLAAAPAYLRRHGDQAGFVEDVLQEVRLKLFVGEPPKIADYVGRGPLDAWLRVTATRIAINLADKTWRETAGDGTGIEDAPATSGDPELDMIRAKYQPAFAAAFDEAMSALAPEERTMLKLYLVERLNIGEIGKLVGLSRATVGRRILECRTRVLERTRAGLQARLGAHESEISSLIYLLASRVDASVQRYLTGA